MSAPWKGELRRWHANWIVDESGEDIAQAHGDAREGQDAKARAKALVNRANAYPKLVEALERIAKRANRKEWLDADCGAAHHMAEIARAALASTQEERE